MKTMHWKRVIIYSSIMSATFYIAAFAYFWLAKFAQRAKNVKLALNSKITHLNSRSQSALASNILVQHIEQPMHRYLFLRLMD
ncbi:hypothetical protein CEQ32_23015 (plasmid) [Shewanella sp. FDAARGOS_354]|nr:hypothetical protein CEQ32_23015 [Shewanella sp. FDAARGOS_354]